MPAWLMLWIAIGISPDAPCIEAAASCTFAWGAGNRAAAWLCGRDNALVPTDATSCRKLVEELERSAWVCDGPRSAKAIIRRIVAIETSKKRDTARLDRAREELTDRARRCLLKKAIEYTPQIEDE
jgi:hypothetical protein